MANIGQALRGDRAQAAIDNRERGKRICFLPQISNVHWDIDVQILVALGRFAHRSGWGETKQDRDASVAAMNSNDVARYARTGVNSLSGGERCHVLLAGVLARTSEWLLADEPLASLDPAHQLDGLDLLRKVSLNGVGAILVMHDLGHALRAADDVDLLQEGRLIAVGACAEVLTAPAVARTIGVAVEIGETPQGAPYIIPIQRTRP